jgi:hypothetical protein
MENIINSKRKLFKRADSCMIKSNILSMYKETSYEKKEKTIVLTVKNNELDISSKPEVKNEQKTNKIDESILIKHVDIELSEQQKNNKLNTEVIEDTKKFIEDIKEKNGFAEDFNFRFEDLIDCFAKPHKQEEYLKMMKKAIAFSLHTNEFYIFDKTGGIWCEDLKKHTSWTLPLIIEKDKEIINDKKKKEPIITFKSIYNANSYQFSYEDVVFEPYNQRFPKPNHPGVLNTFKPCYQIINKVNESLFAPITEYISLILCPAESVDGKPTWDQKHYNYLINWMAHSLQFPMSVDKTAIVLYGAPGTGKTFFSHIVEQIYKIYHYKANSLDNVVSKFNGGLRNKLIIQIDDSTPLQGKKNELLKDLIANPYLEYENKGKDKKDKFYGRFIVNINHPNVLKMSIDCRKYDVHKLSNLRVGDTKYFYDLDEKYVKNEEVMTHFYNFLLQRDVSNFSPCRDLIMSPAKIK